MPEKTYVMDVEHLFDIYKQIQELKSKYPNDADLGAKVRELLNTNNLWTKDI